MHSVRVLFAALALGLSSAATATLAAPVPFFAPPPAWVDVAPIPAPPPEAGAPALQTLLDDNQSRLGPDGDAYYNRRIRKILKPEGLAGLTNFGDTWSPDTETVTFHTLQIIRDGKTIDLLQGGKKMLVLRRESDLERAMLDGRMTASQQLEGLQVGDVLDVSWTRTRKDPIVQGRSYGAEALAFPGVAGRYRVRNSWPDATKLTWKATEGFGTPVITHRDGRTWLETDQTNVAAPKPPVGAPLRFRRVGTLESSSFASWSEVSRLMWPHYAKAIALPAGSAVKAQAEAIAATTTDPGERAFAALRLVEDKTRYFFIGMGDGGYVPAKAEETWSRKFGDCKGKSVLLLALLKELGVAAEPALVSLGGGDGMDERPPSLAAFNHVIVRATVAGKVYWLDGTRSGDRSGLAALRPPGHRWALPLRAGGAELEPIVVPPLDKPAAEILTRFDLSGGLDAKAPMTSTTRVTADAANAMRQAVARTPRPDLERTFRQTLSGAMSWVDVQSVDWVDDVAHDAFEIRVTGTADVDWRDNPDLGLREFKVAGSSTMTGGFPRREPGPNRDAPFATPFPMYVRAVNEFVLPNGGKGFTVRGPNGDETVAGMELKRSSVITGGVARFTTETRSLVPEISAAEAEAATRAMRRLAGEDSVIRAPKAAAPVAEKPAKAAAAASR